MPEQICLELLDISGNLRVIIVRRNDGRFSYRQQEKQDAGWSPATIDAGIYDSAESAETEARQRVAWLRALFH
jgi:hypothetical protein